MSSTDFKQVNEKLVDRILEQGQKLRNAMVQSILQNDPLNSEIIYNKHFNTPISSATSLSDKKVGGETNLLEAFLNGDYLSKNEEETALNTIRTMSVSDICKTTERTLLSKCSCATCNAYNKNNLKCDLRRTENVKEKCLSNYIKDKNWGSEYILKYVDTLKVILQSIHLNNFGNKRVSQSVHKSQFNLGINETYFVEYYIPEILIKELPKSQSKTDSGLESNHVRVCARRSSEDAVLSEKVPSDDTDSGGEYKDAEVNFKSNILKEDIVPVTKEIKDDIQKDKPVAVTKQNLAKPSLKSVYFNRNKEKDLNPLPVTEELNKVKNFNEGSKKELLLGFIYISEAQFLSICPTSYILCQPYCQSETSSSKTVYNSTNPLYNFCQTVPLLYEDDILLKLRENFMVIEFWEKQDQTDQLFGSTRLPLHQFYLAYRNAIILQHLKINKLPIIGTDWWEPIYSTDSHVLIGQVQILTALGTEEQIRNLELERGFKDDIVKAKFPSSSQVKTNVKVPQTSSYFHGGAHVFHKHRKILSKNDILNNLSHPSSSREPIRELRPQKPSLQSDKGVNTVNEPIKESKPRKIDVAVQSDMDREITNKNNSQNLPQMQDVLSSFMKLLEQRPVRMDNSTNTELVATSGPSMPAPRNNEPEVAQVRATSELLDSLQKALTVDCKPVKKIEKLSSFSVQIVINGANQLPSRRKIKSRSKRTKGKSPRQEENILPSTYVSFETMPGEALQVTNVFAKSTSPQWNYRCEVNLPMDLLANSQKRLIFKVWKKCNNAVLQSNMQADVVLGFAAVDLTVLLVGLPNIQGWFNIVDFAGKCNGQINIHVIPLENLEKACCSSKNAIDVVSSKTTLSRATAEQEEPDELLSRALKRKFTELDEITQRLRLRLSEVVSEDSEGSNDEIAEEFENDINNLCIEEDFDLINFEAEARKLNGNNSVQKSEVLDQKPPRSDLLSFTSQQGSSQQFVDEKDMKADGKLGSYISELSVDKDNSSENSESCTTESSFMDKHIMQGKQRIDTLLEKLSLINAEVTQPFASRYVSGCSVSTADTTDAQGIFKHLEQHSRPNITAGTSYDTVMFQQLYREGSNSLSSERSNLGTLGGSETSVITNFSECRPNPDGQGTNSDDKGT